MSLAILFIGDIRTFALHFVRLHILGRVDDWSATGGASVHQISGHLGLAIDHDRLAAGQRLQVNAHALAGNQQLNAFVDQAFGIHAFMDTGFAQHVDSALLQHPGTDAAEDVIRRLTFKNDIVDAGLEQQLAQQKTGRTSTDDSDLSFHYFDFS